MARSRNIKPGLYKNEDLAECSIWARYLFPGLWMLADRDGRLEDRPKRIKGELLPFDSQDVEPLLRELAARDFILRYEVDGASYIQILKFKEHQTPHYTEKPSVIKPPPLQEKQPDMRQKDSGSDQPIKRGSKPPDSLIPDSLIPDSPKKTARKRASPKSPLPDGFGISERVRDWASRNGFVDKLDDYLAFFVSKARARGYTYADWDEALMGCVREDWPKWRSNGSTGPPRTGNAKHDETMRIMDEQRRGRDGSDSGTTIDGTAKRVA